MDLGLEGKVAFVAGASAGLGYATALALLNEGCFVAICSRSQERVQAAANQLLEETGTADTRILPIVCDVTNETAIKEAYQRVIDTWGVIQILITNSGGPPAGFIDDFTSDQWRDALELNLMSTINLSRYALPYLKAASQKGDGLARILMVTSVSARQPIPNLYLSNTARAGVQGFAKSLSEELGPMGITVNTIMPGFTKTERLGELAEAVHKKTGKSIEAIEASWADANALKRMGEPSEFAAAAVFLVSQPAAYITGIGLVVDGGRVKHLV